MKTKITYAGKEIFVEANIKECLDELKRKESNQERRKRRYELPWDSVLIEGMENKHKTVNEIESVEDEVIRSMYIKALKKLINSFDDKDRQLITDRFINEMRYKELKVKYSMPITSIQYRIEKSLKEMKNKFNNTLKNL